MPLWFTCNTLNAPSRSYSFAFFSFFSIEELVLSSHFFSYSALVEEEMDSRRLRSMFYAELREVMCAQYLGLLRGDFIPKDGNILAL